MRCLVKFWTQKDIKISVFIDDGLRKVLTFKISKIEANTGRDSLVKCGFAINEEKYLWYCQKELRWLGINKGVVYHYQKIEQLKS